VAPLLGQLRACGLGEGAIRRVFATFNAAAPVFLELHHPGKDRHDPAR
jgi:hypothetical protein